MVEPTQHIEHFEDRILKLDYWSIRSIDQLVHHLTLNDSRLEIRHKIDGSPALILGNDPSINDGNFFFKTKHKSCPPITSIDDIPKDRPSYFKLVAVAEALRGVNLPGVYQADLMFTPAIKMINHSSISFTPNVITYSVSKECPIFDDVASKNIGLCIHTSHSDGAPTVDVAAVSGQLQDVFVLDNRWSGTLSDRNADIIHKTRIQWRRLADQYLHSKALEVDPRLLPLLVTYSNKMYRKAESQCPNTVEFMQYLRGVQEKEILSRKTPRGKSSVQQTYDEFVTFVLSNTRTFDRVFTMYEFAKTLKHVVMHAFGGIRNVQQAIDGIPSSIGEGLVIKNIDGTLTKLVPRAEFSRANFAKNG